MNLEGKSLQGFVDLILGNLRAKKKLKEYMSRTHEGRSTHDMCFVSLAGINSTISVVFKLLRPNHIQISLRVHAFFDCSVRKLGRARKRHATRLISGLENLETFVHTSSLSYWCLVGIREYMYNIFLYSLLTPVS